VVRDGGGETHHPRRLLCLAPDLLVPSPLGGEDAHHVGFEGGCGGQSHEALDYEVSGCLVVGVVGWRRWVELCLTSLGVGVMGMRGRCEMCNGDGDRGYDGES
jgi:hypothetical protein